MLPTSIARRLRANSRQSSGGHTLPEMLVVLAILTLFAFIVAPRFIGARNRARLDGALQMALNDLSFARARAISTGLRHVVEVDTQSGTLAVTPYHPEDAEVGTSGTAQALPDVAQRDQMPEDVEVTSWTVSPMGMNTSTGGTSGVAGPGPLTFYPEGRSDNASLVLRDGDGDRRGLLVDGYSGVIREMTTDELAQYR